jgi:hypothetical protein
MSEDREMRRIFGTRQQEVDLVRGCRKFRNEELQKFEQFSTYY